MENLLEDYQRWKNEQAKLKKIFPAEIFNTREYAARVVDALTDMLAKYHYKQDVENNFLLSLMRIEVKLHTDRFYGNRKASVLEKVFNFIKFRWKVFKHEQQRRKAIQQTVPARTTVKQTNAIDQKLSREIKSYRPAFRYKVSEKETMDMTVTKHYTEGRLYNNYRIKVQSTGLPERTKDYAFSMAGDIAITDDLAYKLISGRSVCIKDGTWVSLDLNDRAVDGSLKAVFNEGISAGELRQLLRNLPTAKPLEEDSISPLLDALNKGEQPVINVMHNGKEMNVLLAFDAPSSRIRALNDKREPIELGNEARIVKLERAKMAERKNPRFKA